MIFEFVNHASIIYKEKGINLMTDPWLEGTVFHNGWQHLVETKFEYERFKEITHIWFSHEHPDHFFPPNLKKIHPKYRANITILYQETGDQKVIEFCKTLGFKAIVELKAFEWKILVPGFKIICNPLGHDSWLGVKTDSGTFLNTNDCVLKRTIDLLPIQKLMGEIDVLFTQFSFAQHEGNVSEPSKIKAAADRKLTQMDKQLSTFLPKYIVPFASYVWFCHEENFYFNQYMNTPNEVLNHFDQNRISIPIILAPGDIWDFKNDNWNNVNSMLTYQNAILDLENRMQLGSVQIEKEYLIQSAKEFYNKVQSKKSATERKAIPTLKIYLKDLEEVVVLSMNALLHFESSLTEEFSDISMSSDMLKYCLDFDWGFDTATVNGRFQTISPTGFEKLVEVMEFCNELNHDEEHKSVAQRAFGKIKNVVRAYRAKEV